MKSQKLKALFSLFFVLMLSACNSEENSKADFFAMDTSFHIQTVGEGASHELAEAAKQYILCLSDMLDCHNSDSTISQLNSKKAITNPPADVTDILKQTLLLENIYGNAVQLSCYPLTSLWDITGNNPNIPSSSDISMALESINDNRITILNNEIQIDQNMALDFGAVAKGYALDRVADIFDAYELECGIVDAVSSVLIYGRKVDCTDFNVGISSPFGDGLLGEIRIRNDAPDGKLFLSTSGDAERYTEINGVRYGHIFDLATGYPAKTDLCSVTVISSNGILSDFLSTLIFIRGSQNIQEYLEATDFMVLAVAQDGSIYQSEALHFEAYT